MVLFYYNFIQKFNFNLFNLFAIGFLSLVLWFSIRDYDSIRHSTPIFLIYSNSYVRFYWIKNCEKVIVKYSMLIEFSIKKYLN